MVSFWYLELLLGSFWRDFGVILKSRIASGFLFLLEIDFGGFWKPLGEVFGVFWRPLGEVFRDLEASWGDFWTVLKASWGGFSRYFGIFFSFSFRNGFLYTFEMILDGFWYPLEKQKWAFRMEGIAKIQLSCYVNEVETWLTSDMDFWLIFGHFGDILGWKINQKLT